MKKLLALCLAVLMMMALTLPAFAEVSPTADVITTVTGTNDSPTSPQTGYVLVAVAAGLAVAGIGGASVAAKKLSGKN